MRLVTSREYKVMLQHRWFANRKAALGQFWEEAAAIAESSSISVSGDFDRPEKRKIVFFDTTDHSLRRSGLILRRRVEDTGELQFTLKARNEDRYLASGFNMRTSSGLKSTPKFEEDVAAPFRSRFSNSSTVEFDQSSDAPFGSTPKQIKDASALFPALKELRANSNQLPLKTKLVPVNGIKANERVYKGPKLRCGGSGRITVAVIVWTNGWDGRPLVAEFSFRYKDKHENFSAETACSARRFFESVQRLDWCAPASVTKTQYVYRESV